MAESEKAPIVEWLFFQHYNKKSKQFDRTVMTMTDVQDAIRHFRAHHGSTLSDKNPANFMKDIVRGQNASNVWPKSVADLRWTAIQTPGDGNVFEFVPYAADQNEPFPDKYRPRKGISCFAVESVSLPLFSRTLGRNDEPWLVQTAVNLRVVETHFATVSDLPVFQLTHLQMSVKLRKTEIDALFLATCRKGKDEWRAIVTCEAKQWRERILEPQIINQAKAAFDETAVDIVVPIAIRAVKGVGFYIVEFEQVHRKDASKLNQLSVAKEAVYELKPPVPGI